jgi:hypothetical protein
MLFPEAIGPWFEPYGGSDPRTQPRKERFVLYVLKSVPQRLKPSRAQALYGTAEAVPFVRQSSATS